MFSPIKDVQKEAEFVFIEDLVPQNHLLRKVDNERFGFNVEAVGLDSDFLTNSICKGLHDRNILGLYLIEDIIQRKAYFQKGNFNMTRTTIYTFVQTGKNYCIARQQEKVIVNISQIQRNVRNVLW